MKLKKLVILTIFALITFPSWSIDYVIQQAYQAQHGDLQVQGKGYVIKILSDDTKGAKHQCFILRLENKQTLLVAHNIDLAPRVVNLNKGDLVEFYGEYEYNSKGGVIHWTHKSTNNNHSHGWLKHQGTLYQ